MHTQEEYHRSKVFVRCEEDEEDAEAHPHCPHGPTVLFYDKDKGPLQGFYACSAYRHKSLCSFYLPAKELSMKHMRRKYDPSSEGLRKQRQRLLEDKPGTQKNYCLSCNIPMNQSGLHSHLMHDVKLNLSAEMVKDPTVFLPPMDNDKAQAQYFFDEKSLNFFQNTLIDLQFNKVICIGAPRLHGSLIKNYSGHIQSFLLDLDYRFFYFYEDNQYAWFNMCNNHFFDDQQKLEFNKFLHCTSNDRILLFTDPPFGCRTELIGSTLRKITKLYNKVNHLPHQPLPIFWIFPYFAAHYVQQAIPSLQMSDYKVNYTNHLSYTDRGQKSRKLGSPVRLFTNVPLELIKLPALEQYKYCAECKKYTYLENLHCKKCKCCPSKNGSTYKHCAQCGRCVKPTYIHCVNCRRCCQSESHNCQEYQAKQKCWICRQVGHTERQCEFWLKKSTNPVYDKNISRKGQIICLLCNCKGHNELCCEKRSLILNESSFMSEVFLY